MAHLATDEATRRDTLEGIPGSTFALSHVRTKHSEPHFPYHRLNGQIVEELLTAMLIWQTEGEPVHTSTPSNQHAHCRLRG